MGLPRRDHMLGCPVAILSILDMQGCPFLLCNFFQKGLAKNNIALKIIYTGPIDEYYGYKYGALKYRSLGFETEVLDLSNYQVVAGMNYTDSETQYTRIVEHKQFEFGKGNPDKTVITKEYSKEWTTGEEPYYPVNNEVNVAIYNKYRKLAETDDKIHFGGRLGTYQYLDMDKVTALALNDAHIMQKEQESL